jgi:hypothetical protein
MFAQSNCQPVKVNFRFQFLRFSQIQTNFFPSIRFRNLCRVKIDTVKVKNLKFKILKVKFKIS